MTRQQRRLFRNFVRRVPPSAASLGGVAAVYDPELLLSLKAAGAGGQLR
jgi:hypothetical protein